MEARMRERKQEISWSVNFHREFEPEFNRLATPVRLKIAAVAKLLQVFGPQLGRPYVDTLKASMYPNMKELRFDADGGVWRLAFAFDAKRRAILLVAGNKTGRSTAKFYEELIEMADGRFDRHQRELESEARRP
jgi:hypothetical protein